jgi:hypothetical protein
VAGRCQAPSGRASCATGAADSGVASGAAARAKRRLEEEHRVEVSADANYEAYRARGVDKTGRKFGRAPKPFEPPATRAGKVNTTDPDSRNVKTLRGWAQGYNAQAVSTDRQIVIAADLTNSSADFAQLGAARQCRAQRAARGRYRAPAGRRARRRRLLASRSDAGARR